MQYLTPSRLEASLRRTKPDPWEVLMGTVAEAWIEQGFEQGFEQGIAEGIAERITQGLAKEIEKGIERGRREGQAGIVLRLLRRRFGGVPEAVRDRVRGASTVELETWADAVLEAATLDEVLAARRKR